MSYNQKTVGRVLFVVILVAVAVALLYPKAETKRMSYQTNIISTTQKNTNYRTVLYTGNHTQLVVMSIPPGGEVGKETHQHVDQTLFFESGTGNAILNGVTTKIGPGDVVVVPSGTEHNFVNTGSVPLKIYTVYGPPNHIDGRIQATKAAADADTADEAFGNAVK